MPFTIRRPHRRRVPGMRNVPSFSKLLLICCSSFVGGLLLITLLLLLLHPAPVYAEWVLVTADSKARGGFSIYADPTTIRRKGDLVKMLVLLDFKTTQTSTGESYLSMMQHAEYGWAEKLFRILKFMEYSGNMGSGNVVYTGSDEQKWQPVAPRSFAEDVWALACGKKRR